MKGPYILTGIGCFFLALSVLVLLVSVALPPLTNGRTSWDEAVPGIVGGALCGCTSVLPVAAGIVWLLSARKKTPPAG